MIKIKLNHVKQPDSTGISLNDISMFPSAQMLVVFFFPPPFCLVSRHYSKLACVICANCPRGFLKSIPEVCQHQHLIQQVVMECSLPCLHALIRRRNLPLSNGISVQALAAEEQATRFLQEQALLGRRSGEFCMWD